MACPFREDKHESFSCFRTHEGFWKGKDHSTGEVYDNIDIYREQHPECAYAEAVDQLAWLLFAKSAYIGNDTVPARSSPKNVRKVVSNIVRPLEPDRKSVLDVLRVLPLWDSRTPEELRSYWRSRGISDANIFSTCFYAVYENPNQKGNLIRDVKSGLVVCDRKGNELVDTGRRDAVALYNDIGGLVFRVPKSLYHLGFKGGTSSFISTLLADGSRPSSAVVFDGSGSNVVEKAEYDAIHESLFINGSQRFLGVFPEAVRFITPLIHDLKGITLDERDVKRLTAVMTNLNSPVCGKAAVVEGMFDGLSFQEMQGMAGRGFKPGVDLVILNSISNLKQCVPFLCRQEEVLVIYDNDLRTGAGRKAFDSLKQEVEHYSKRCFSNTKVLSGSYLLQGCNDLNDSLVRQKKGSRTEAKLKPKVKRNSGEKNQNHIKF